MDLCQSPHIAGKQMSSSLKDRLKRLAQYKTSPLAQYKTSPISPVLSTARTETNKNENCQNLSMSAKEKNTNFDIERTEDFSTLSSKNIQFVSNVISCHNLCLKSVQEIDDCNDKDKLETCFSHLETMVSQEKEKLRKLHMAKLYHTKNDPESFMVLINKWQKTSQEALQDLYELIPEPRPTMTELLNYLQIEHKLVRYNSEDESFL